MKNQSLNKCLVSTYHMPGPTQNRQWGSLPHRADSEEAGDLVQVQRDQGEAQLELNLYVEEGQRLLSMEVTVELRPQRQVELSLGKGARTVFLAEGTAWEK